MHRCWSILEVQRAIFQEIDQLYNGKITLARVARTCRTLNSVALDVLWADLDSFMHLIICLPRDLWKVEPYGSLTFLRPMSLKDWEVFFSYSNRVRTLSQKFLRIYLPQLCSNVDTDVIHTLSNPPTSGPLIPNLRELRWDTPDETHVPLLRVLLTPTLVTLSLKSCASCIPASLPLTSIGIVCPSLKNLHITWSMGTPSALGVRGRKILSEMLLPLHSLEVLWCPMPDDGAVVHLSHLLSLVDLTLELPSDFQLDRIKHCAAPPAFASLTSLKLYARSLSTLTSLIESIRLKPKKVQLELEDTPTPEALRLFFLALVRSCDPKELLHISFTAGMQQSRAIPQDAVFTLSTLQPLLALPNINMFKFNMPCDIVLDDAAIILLTTHWPNIITLSINAKIGWGIPSRVTHHGLIMLLGRCTALREFSLAIDFSQVDRRSFDMTRLGGGVSNVRCRVANFVTSAIESSLAIALFLSDVCPNLITVGSSWSFLFPTSRMNVSGKEVAEYDRRWEEVDKFLPAFSAARKQTIYWAQQAENSGSVASGSVLDADRR